MSALHGSDEAAKARVLLALLALAWGLSWPVMRIALDEVSVWTLRCLGYTISAASLFAVMRLQGRSADIPTGTARWHVLGASVFNVVGLGLCMSFAQLSATTSRVIIVNYSMPIWSSLMAWVILRERPNARALAGLALCLAGLATLVYPVATAQSALGLLLAFGSALCWGAGTIYMKWARIPGDFLAIVAWQMVAGVVVFGAGFVVFHGFASPTPVSLTAVLALIYNGTISTGIAYILWFAIIERLSTATASLGSLATPVVGIVSSMILLGERPTFPDLVGFGLIFAAALCVLVQPRRRATASVRSP